MNKKILEFLNNQSHDVGNLEEFLIQLRDMPSSEKKNFVYHDSCIHSIHVIGFHHKKGSIVEFSYPGEVQCELLPYLSLPDNVHNESVKTI